MALLLLSLLGMMHCMGVTLPGDLFIKNDLRGNVLYLTNANSTLTCISVMSQSLDSDSVSGDEVDADNVQVGHVYPRTQDFIKLYGHMSISGAVQMAPQPTSFVEVKEEVMYQGIRQWTLFEQDYFFDGENNGWKVKQLLSPFLKVNRQVINQAKQGISAGFNQVLEKNLKVEASHQYIKIEGSFHFIGALWQGQRLSLKVDGRTVWTDSHDWMDLPVSDCGSMLSLLQSLYHKSPINLVIKTTLPNLLVRLESSFSTSHLSATHKNCIDQYVAMGRIQLFGFDSLSFYYK